MTDVEQRTACVRKDHPDGYIELTYTEVSRRAVDDLIDHLKDIAGKSRYTPELMPPTIRVFVNSSGVSSGQTISYLVSRLRQDRRQITARKPVRLAVIFHNPSVVWIINMFLDTLYSGEIIFRAFNPSQGDEARAWVLLDE
jgi:hypothetical protein